MQDHYSENSSARTTRYLRRVTVAVAVILVSSVAAAASRDGANQVTRFTRYSSRSTLKVDHEMFTKLLKYAVKPYDSNQDSGATTRHRRPRTGTRIRTSTAKTSKRKRLNLVAYRFTNQSPAFRRVLDNYLRYLEEVPISHLNREEQLAFWLNFHNAGLLQMLVDDYKVRHLDFQLDPTGPRQGQYFRKIFTVENQPLSLADIRDDIILANWQDPMVVYGIYTGARSGPNIMTQAFTGQNVHALLEKNARDFVRAPRTIRVFGKTLSYAKLYDWYMRRFGGRDGVVDHLRKFADTRTNQQLDTVHYVRSQKFVWKLAELRSKSSAFAVAGTEGIATDEGRIQFGVWSSCRSVGRC